jgi:glycosyltransferase involved in cell wall biosynthesis
MALLRPHGLSIIVPFFNEARVIKKVLIDLHTFMQTVGIPFEIITVNDGSHDGGGDIVRTITGVTLIEHGRNRGYGASIKTGVSHSQYEWILWYDGDGQHTPENVESVLDFAEGEVMVVGARTAQKNPLIRRPGKMILSAIANYLVDTHIPDLNSGLRMVRKDIFEKFVHLYPNGFSISTTITLSVLKAQYVVRYVPIHIEERVGKSTVSPKDAFRMLSLIFRIITLFSPLRVFMPLTILTAILTFISFCYDVLVHNLTDTTVVLFLSTLMMFSFGVTLDHVAAIRRDMHNL